MVNDHSINIASFHVCVSACELPRMAQGCISLYNVMHSPPGVKIIVSESASGGF